MTRYIITKEGLPQIIADIDSRLSQVEVKGESVTHLFIARAMFKELAESFQEVKDEVVKPDTPKAEGG